MKKIMDLKCNGKHFVCKMDGAKSVHPYRLYEEWNERTEHGLVKHSRLIVKNSAIDGILFYIWSQGLTK